MTGQPMDELLRELQSQGITDLRVLDAIRFVPRDLFVPPESRSQAFRDIPLAIGDGQTISQPLVVAMMMEATALQGTDVVLEIGTGSGYQAALLTVLAYRVISMERLPSLAATARRRLADLGFFRVEVVLGDGSLGYTAAAPYDAILVTASCPRTPQPLVDQLAEGGRLILPIGSPTSQELVLHRKRDGKLITEQLGPVRFVPLIGKSAWKEHEVSDIE